MRPIDGPAISLLAVFPRFPTLPPAAPEYVCAESANVIGFPFDASIRSGLTKARDRDGATRFRAHIDRLQSA
ncbi:hypothetical protein [Burkholderia pyrrocinia]|uniref:hypothetical protein n=1 Tax=Burkholderia pyrrocinia TaxID=60550 RepID=UPI002AB1E6E4|nr:hypothetical protein [Burkholderia pyrrocinia]